MCEPTPMGSLVIREGRECSAPVPVPQRNFTSLCSSGCYLASSVSRSDEVPIGKLVDVSVGAPLPLPQL